MTYTRENPSLEYVEAVRLGRAYHATRKTFTGRHVFQSFPILRQLIDLTSSKSILEYGCGKGHQWTYHDIRLLKTKDDEVKTRYATWQEALGVGECIGYDPCVPEYDTLPQRKFDGVISTDVLEYIPPQDQPWVLDELFSFADKFVYSSFALFPGKKMLGDGSLAHKTMESVEWWVNLWHETAQRYPTLRWEIRIEPDAPPITHRRFYGMGNDWCEGENWWKIWKEDQLKTLTKKQREELEMIAKSQKHPIDPRALGNKS